MSNKQLITKLFEYTYWANGRILACAAQVSEEQLRAGMENGRSLHQLLFHILRTEWAWLRVCQTGVQPDNPIQPDQFPTLAALQQQWQDEQQRMFTYLNNLSETALNSPTTIQDWRGNQYQLVLGQLLTHVALHGMQHRSEAAMLLSQYGQSPGDIDFFFFILQNP